MSPEVTKKLDDYFAKYALRTYPKGQILIQAGDSPERILYLVKGKVRQYDISYRGDEVVVNTFKPPAFFPMLWALTKLPNKYFFAAETEIELRSAPPEETIDFLKANPDVLLDLMTRVYKGIDDILGRMVRLMSGSAKSRLLYELLIECRRFGEKAEDGSCLLTIHESDLAARAGLSRETVSREIHKASEDDLISVGHNGILVKNLRALEDRLGETL